MSNISMTVSELIDELNKYPKDAHVYHIETIDGEPQDMYFAITTVFKQDENVMLY